MLAKHHHVNKSQKIEQVDIRSINILNRMALIINPYECSEGTTKPYKIKLEHIDVHYNHKVLNH